MASLHVFTAFLAAVFIGSSTAYQFNVGGRHHGWAVNPSENYNHWAERMRFQVNDTLFFRYKNREDSVLVVNRGDYDNCNTNNPIEKFDGGDSIFKFERSGPFFFISGHGDNCQKGQKLIVVVMAVRNKKSPPSSPPPFPDHAPAPAAGGESTPTPIPSPATAPPPHRSAASGVSRPSVLLVILLSVTLSKFGLF